MFFVGAVTKILLLMQKVYIAMQCKPFVQIYVLP